MQFTVQSGVNTAASLADINKKDGIRASLGTLSQKMGMCYIDYDSITLSVTKRSNEMILFFLY